VLTEPKLTPADLADLLESVDPAALLVPPRLLRRIIKHDRKLTHFGLQVPHRKCYVIEREALLALTTPEEIGVPLQRELPDTLLLLYRPDSEKMAGEGSGPTLVKYWRLLFHARIHDALETKFKQGNMTEAALRRRIHHMGPMEFNEVRTVLRQERLLLPPFDERTVYEEFAAVYLELRFFAPRLLPRYFSAFDEFGRIDQMLAEDIDGAAIFQATRLPGAPDPETLEIDAEQADLPRPSADTTLVWTRSEKEYQALTVRADKASAKGNGVRAAIFRARAALVAAPLMVRETQERTQAEVDQLSERLRHALNFEESALATWRRGLAALVAQAIDGIWPAEARLLYDLQKICVDCERPIYDPDLVEWAYSYFRQPLLRPLPNQPLILAVKHLRVAVGRLPSVRLEDAQRHVLSGLLHDALHHAEARLRERFRPALVDALARVDLQPQNYPERLGRAKLIEELLDRISERGFLNMSDLRDALARNQLKLPDLSGPGEFLQGDPLIKANRELAVGAADVYRRGEFYMRWLQRGSSLAFGTQIGRLLMLFCVLPILAAYATVVFTQELLGLCGLPHHLGRTRWYATIGCLSVFNFMLMHLPAFRVATISGLHAAWRLLRALFYDMPVAFFALPSVRRFFRSQPFLFVVRFILKPLPIALLAGVLLDAFHFRLETAVWGGGLVFIFVALLINSRLGRDLEEAFIDRTVREWEYVQGLVPGIFRLVMEIFKSILEGFDRFFYTVDEWLRFRGGQGRLALVFKTVFGFLWFLVSYLVRMFINVFIEPTINPIKHFPVVTVAAKLLVPLWPYLIGVPHNLGIFGQPFQFLGNWPAWLMANVIVHSIPGAAGFLVWEFKENWRLYRANRPVTLRPEVIGHHGETMLRLLKPGFHSGTLPKLYAKLRGAERRAYRKGTWTTARRLREKLHDVEESIRHFTERELLAFLNNCSDWKVGTIELTKVEACSSRVRLEMTVAGTLRVPSAAPLEIHFEEIAGWLLARIAKPGWLPALDIDQAKLWKTALRGFYKKAGVDIVREQVEACLGSPCPPYDIAEEGLVVWPGLDYETEVIYDLREGPMIHPRLKEKQLAENMPALAADKVLFNRNPVSWDEWVADWRN
jgi:hypothetical protein